MSALAVRDWLVSEAAGDLDHSAFVSVSRDIRVDAEDLLDALSRLSPWRERLTLVLQPVTPFGAVTSAPRAEVLTDYAAEASGRGFDVRVLPQLHKTLGLD